MHSSRVGRHDQRARISLAAVGRGRILQQMLEDRQQERGGLAGARLGAAADVGAVERQRQRLGLDGRAIAEIQVGQRVQQHVGQAQVEKPGLPLRLRHLVFGRIPRLAMETGSLPARRGGAWDGPADGARRASCAGRPARLRAGRWRLGPSSKRAAARRLLGMRLLRLGHRGGHRRDMLGLFAAERGLDSLDEVHNGPDSIIPPPVAMQKNPRLAGGANLLTLWE
jgi:hypothetical protein